MNKIIFNREIRYCWIDEDGTRMSPIHGDLGKALSFLARFNEARERLEKKAEETQAKHAQDSARWPDRSTDWFESQMDKINKSKDSITSTGKPPKTLKRLVTTTVVEDTTEAEATVVAELYAKEFPDG